MLAPRIETDCEALGTLAALQERPSTAATQYMNTAALGPDLPEGETRRRPRMSLGANGEEHFTQCARDTRP
jgi:hypothetical protein